MAAERLAATEAAQAEVRQLAAQRAELEGQLARLSAGQLAKEDGLAGEMQVRRIQCSAKSSSSIWMRAFMGVVLQRRFDVHYYA